MSDLNEYMAEAIEAAYGVEYDTRKASAVIDWLATHRWVIRDADEIDWDRA